MSFSGRTSVSKTDNESSILSTPAKLLPGDEGSVRTGGRVLLALHIFAKVRYLCSETKRNISAY